MLHLTSVLERFHNVRFRLGADTIERFRERVTQLYEQGASTTRIGAYETRWWRWVRAGLPENQVLVKHHVQEERCKERVNSW